VIRVKISFSEEYILARNLLHCLIEIFADIYETIKLKENRTN
jgi:hypothetical protein